MDITYISLSDAEETTCYISDELQSFVGFGLKYPLVYLVTGVS